MSLPCGWITGDVFVCRDCATEAARKGLRCDDRVASGKTCDRCGEQMPYEVVVRLLPDGMHSIATPANWLHGERSIKVERSESALIAENALVYVAIGCQLEVGINVTPNGGVSVWVHDDPYGDGDAPAARWEYTP